MPASSSSSTSKTIAMTSPVVSVPRPRIGAPAKATQTCVSSPLLSGDAVDVMFVMPRKYKSLTDLPAPRDPRVQVEAQDERWEAVTRWYGAYPSQAEFEARTLRLVSALRSEKLETASPVPQLGAEDMVQHPTDSTPSSSSARAPFIAKSYSYDPPWTPWFMKQNEVAVVVQPPREVTIPE